MPDLEVFTAPVKKSVNGVLQYNTPSTNRGFTFENVRLEFEKGEIVKATANDSKRLNAILNTDDGARYIGEFALGVHPLINHPMDDTLFDEKINGSFHFTPGNAYEDEADNGNRSAIHWDMVCIQRPDYGGGEMYFDGDLIRKDGRFVPKILQKLNPENLIVRE
jgi:aminopeptidase